MSIGRVPACPDCGSRLKEALGATPGFMFCERCSAFVRPSEFNSPALIDGGAKEKQIEPAPLEFVTAAALTAETPREPVWVVQPFAALGARTMISGKPKAAGKTTFVIQVCRSAITGEPFLGARPARMGPVVLLSEEGSVSIAQALHRGGMAGSTDLHILRYAPGHPWAGVARQAIAKAREVGAVILAVDTLPAWAQIPRDEENSAGTAREVFDPFTGVDDLALLVAFHNRKSGGEPGEATRGSGAFAGAVDIIIDIARVGLEGQESRRELSMLGRFEIPDKLIVEWTGDSYHLLGSAEDVHGQDVKRAIKETLDGRVLTEPEITDALTDYRKTSLAKALRALVAAGEVKRDGDGKKGRPFRYSFSFSPLYSAGETNPTHQNGHTPRPLVQAALALGAKAVNE